MEITAISYNYLAYPIPIGFVLAILGGIIIKRRFWSGILVLIASAVLIMIPADRAFMNITQGTAEIIAKGGGYQQIISSAPDTKTIRVEVDLVLDEGKIVKLKTVRDSAKGIR